MDYRVRKGVILAELRRDLIAIEDAVEVVDRLLSGDVLYEDISSLKAAKEVMERSVRAVEAWPADSLPATLPELDAS
jgi:hypothetical protein